MSRSHPSAAEEGEEKENAVTATSSAVAVCVFTVVELMSPSLFENPFSCLNDNPLFNFFTTAEVVCPPCPRPIVRPCQGCHTTSRVACHTPRDIYCGLQCGNPLRCGHHQCTQPCHRVTRPRDMRYVKLYQELRYKH